MVGKKGGCILPNPRIMARLTRDLVPDPPTSDDCLGAFLDYLAAEKIEPYGHQEEAVLQLYEGRNVILNTPTGSGKSLVALAMHFRALCLGRRSWYTVPIKALANEKFLSLCRVFGPDQVGMITGDATVNREAPVICCTAEILANVALAGGSRAPVDDVIMDEFHYYSDSARGSAWQIPLLTLPQARFLLMSATLGDTTFFEKALTELTGARTVLVQSSERPVPLEFAYSETTLEEKVTELVGQGKAPIYLVHFTQLACAGTAQNLLSQNVCSKEEKALISEALQGFAFRSPYGKEIQKLLRHGIGIHHAGLLPKYRVLVEKLAQRGLLKVVCGTDTLGVGINVPIRTVLFTQLCKYDGTGTKILSVRDFQQICGRAGRRGFDTTGHVVAQAPEHVIENLRMERKAAANPGRKQNFVKKKPPEKGYVAWDENTFRRLIASPPEKLTSSFRITHAMLLQALSRREEDGCAVMRDLIGRCHESPGQRKKLRREAFRCFRGLVRGQILTIIPPAQRSGAPKVRLHVDLQEDFSLFHTLGLWLIDAIPQLEVESPGYALQVVSLCEAILENPEVILRRQVDALKNELMADLKAEGVEYEERLLRLEEVEWPKPGKEFIYHTFNRFCETHPWVDKGTIRPKSIGREMFESWSSFEDYIKRYGLERSEGVLLRHLAELYKVLDQTVPALRKTEAVDEAIGFFEAILRGVDSSLLDEWVRMREAGGQGAGPDAGEGGTGPGQLPPLTRDRRAFTRLVRADIFELLKALDRRQWTAVLEQLGAAEDHEDLAWTPARLEAAMTEYRVAHERIRLDPEARSLPYTRIREGTGKEQGFWWIEQILLDPDESNDWSIGLLVDLPRSDEARTPWLRLLWIGEVGLVGAS
jgi:superfamily II RNA helicase